MSDLLQARWLSNAVILLLLLTVGSFLFPFLSPFAWGFWFAVLTWPLFQWLNNRLKRPWLSASLMLVILAIIIGLPVALLWQVTLMELNKLFQFILLANQHGLPAPQWLPKLPVVGPEALQWWDENLARPHGVAALFGAEWQSISKAARAMFSLIGNWVVKNLFLILFSFIVLVCFYIHGQPIARTLLQLSPRIHPLAPQFMLAIPQALRATAYGLGLIAVLEGVVLGLAYWIAGLPSPALFGLVSGILALVPGGAPLSFTMASLFLYVTGHPLNAIGLFLWGTIELFLVDKFIRPQLIGSVIKLPFLPVFVGLVGGLQMFGLLGLVYGPAVMMLAVMLWRRASAAENPAQVPGGSLIAASKRK